MNKALILKRLHATRDKLNALPDSKFLYADFITDYEVKGGPVKVGEQRTVCGTVCCAAGWYPVWFPNSGLCYSTFPGCVKLATKIDGSFTNTNAIRLVLMDWHGLSRQTINMLFFGDCATYTLTKKGLKNIDAVVKYIIYHRCSVYCPYNPTTMELNISLIHGIDSTRADVINLFVMLIILIKNNYILWKNA